MLSKESLEFIKELLGMMQISFADPTWETVVPKVTQLRQELFQALQPVPVDQTPAESDPILTEKTPS